MSFVFCLLSLPVRLSFVSVVFDFSASLNDDIHSLVNATTLQELNVEVRGLRHLSMHN